MALAALRRLAAGQQAPGGSVLAHLLQGRTAGPFAAAPQFAREIRSTARRALVDESATATGTGTRAPPSWVASIQRRWATAAPASESAAAHAHAHAPTPTPLLGSSTQPPLLQGRQRLVTLRMYGSESGKAPTSSSSSSPSSAPPGGAHPHPEGAAQRIQSAASHTMQTYRAMEEYLRYRGYNTLGILLGLVATGGILLYINAEKVRKRVSVEVAGVTKRSLEDKEVIDQTNEFSKVVVKTILNDPSTLKHTVSLLTDLLAQQATRDSLILLLNQVLQDPTFAKQMEVFFIGLIQHIAKSPDVMKSLAGLVADVLAQPETYKATSKLVGSLVVDPTTVHQLSVLVNQVLAMDSVREQTYALGNQVTHDLLDDKAIQAHTTQFFTQTLSNQDLHQQGGDALWEAIKYSVTPKFFTRRSAPAPPPPPPQGSTVESVHPSSSTTSSTSSTSSTSTPGSPSAPASNTAPADQKVVSAPEPPSKPKAEAATPSSTKADTAVKSDTSAAPAKAGTPLKAGGSSPPKAASGTEEDLPSVPVHVPSPSSVPETLVVPAALPEVSSLLQAPEEHLPSSLPSSSSSFLDEGSSLGSDKAPSSVVSEETAPATEHREKAKDDGGDPPANAATSPPIPKAPHAPQAPQGAAPSSSTSTSIVGATLSTLQSTLGKLNPLHLLTPPAPTVHVTIKLPGSAKTEGPGVSTTADFTPSQRVSGGTYSWSL